MLLQVFVTIFIRIPYTLQQPEDHIWAPTIDIFSRINVAQWDRILFVQYSQHFVDVMQCTRGRSRHRVNSFYFPFLQNADYLAKQDSINN